MIYIRTTAAYHLGKKYVKHFLLLPITVGGNKFISNFSKSNYNSIIEGSWTTLCG